MVAAGCAAAVTGVAGCGGADPTGPQRTATAFTRAVGDGDAAAACELLSPEVRAEVGESAEGSCADAVRESPPPSSTAVVRTERFGRQALVVTDGDTLFLSEFSDGWKVIGAGCTARASSPTSSLPYDCQISGG
jgi:hypothetical protein